MTASVASKVAVPNRISWGGVAASGLVSLFLLFDAVIHLAKIAPVVDAFARLGIPIGLAVALGVIELACVLLYVYPRTAVLGAILLAGYLGGAVVTHLRAGSSLFGETLFPIYVGILVWGGLYLRERRLPELLTKFRVSKNTNSSRKMLWAGRVASALAILMMLFAAGVKLVHSPEVVAGFRQSGFAEPLVLTVGLIELICTVAYAIPWTRFLGAILMTGVMGGAIATDLRVADPSWTLAAVVGLLVWAGLFWRDDRVRALIPFRD
jgi:hypothetical protein